MPHVSFGHVIWLAGGCSAKDVGVDKVTPATTLLDTENTPEESSFSNELQSVCWKPVATCVLQQELSSCSTEPAILRETRTFYDCGFQFAPESIGIGSIKFQVASTILLHEEQYARCRGGRERSRSVSIKSEPMVPACMRGRSWDHA